MIALNHHELEEKRERFGMKSVEQMDEVIDKLNAEVGDLGQWSPPAVLKLHEWIREVDGLIRKEFARRAAGHHMNPRR